MKELEPPDSHYLSAAQGWMMLGVPREAAAELEKISQTNHIQVLETRWQVEAAFKNWEKCVLVASQTLQLEPDSPSGWIHRSFSLHELKRTQEAWDLLLPAAQKFSQEMIIPYNLACYACQLGHLDKARLWLHRAVEIGGREQIIEMAATDPDLEPLRAELDAF